MLIVSWVGLAVAVAVVVYTYVGYPLALAAVARINDATPAHSSANEWPSVSISVPVYNEEHNMEDLLETLLLLEYPRDRLQILIISDGSTDRTAEITERYREQGVELLELPRRAGKTSAETTALPHLRGEIVVNTDASVRIPKNALKPLVAAFRDPSVGVASGRDVSVASLRDNATAGESAYVSYEMWVRELETRAGGIVGASGCFYAMRSHLHSLRIPAPLSRDFAAPLSARERGYRSVAVADAACLVPRTTSLRTEYRRKVRTIARGIATLHYKAGLLNPFRYPLFAWMLTSHKVCRWGVPWAAAAAFGVGAVEGVRHGLAPWFAAAGLVAGVLVGLAWVWPEERRLPKAIALPVFAIMGNLAAMHAAIGAFSKGSKAAWEPTRRDATGLENRSPARTARRG